MTDSYSTHKAYFFQSIKAINSYGHSVEIMDEERLIKEGNDDFIVSAVFYGSVGKEIKLSNYR